MQDPKLLILDEPTSGLDPLMQNKFVELILQEKKRGKTILMSSHSFEEVEKTCDRAAIIRGGKLAAVEEMERLRTGRKKDRTAGTGNRRDGIRSGRRISGSRIAGTYGDCESGKGSRSADQKASQYKVLDMEIRTQSLEEFFMHFYGGEENV